MASATEELNVLLYLIYIILSLNLNSHLWLMALVFWTGALEILSFGPTNMMSVVLMLAQGKG